MTVLVAGFVARIARACRRRSSVEIASYVGNTRKTLVSHLLFHGTAQSSEAIIQGRGIGAMEFDRLGAFDNDEGKVESKIASLTGLLAAK